jgi:hypothetical protein
MRQQFNLLLILLLALATIAGIWLLGGFLLVCVVAVLLRFLLIRMVVPTTLAAFLGLLVHLDEND